MKVPQQTALLALAACLITGPVTDASASESPVIPDKKIYFVATDFAGDDLYAYLRENFSNVLVPGSYTDSAPAATADDVVIVSRSTNSGNYDDSAAEIDSWNALPCKVFVANAYLIRSSRWGWTDAAGVTSSDASTAVTLNVPSDALFSGVSANPINLYTDSVDLVDPVGLGAAVKLAETSDGLVALRAAAGDALAVTDPGGFSLSRLSHAAERIFFALPSDETALTPDGQLVLENILVDELGLTRLENPNPTTAGAALDETIPSWIFGYEHFRLSNDLTGPDSGPTGNIDLDRFTNLEEWAFSFDPQQQDNASSVLQASLPSSDSLRLQYRRHARSPHLSFSIEEAPDLVSWQAMSPQPAITESNPLTSSTEEVGARIDLSGAPANFYQIRISLDDSQINQIFTIDDQSDFDALKNSSFSPGDLILFKRGQIFSGSFAPRGSGTAAAPIRIASYGEGPMPIINALGVHKAAVHLRNVEYWEVHGLELTNTDGSDDHQGRIMGVYIETNSARPRSVMRHLHVKNCYIHSVNGTTLDSDPDGAKLHGGIHVHTYGVIPTRIDDLQIVGNTVQRTGGVGIGLDSRFNDVIGGDISQLWTNVYIAKNFIDDTDRNNMIVRHSLNPLVEYNVLANSSRANTGHSLFNFAAVGLVAQYNEAYGNTGAGGKDRGGFDADWNCRDSVFQYNYSHDNLWFIGIMRRWNKGVDIRYNISQNDQEGFCFFGFNNDTGAEDIRIYNNVYYVGPGITDAQFVAENRTPLNTKFYNNIFYFAGGGSYGSNMQNMQNSELTHNAYFGIPPWPGDANAITADPMLVAPGSGRVNIDMSDPHRLPGYRLQAGSPLIDAGISGPDYPSGSQDFWGNPVPNGAAVDIGAHEY